MKRINSYFAVSDRPWDCSDIKYLDPDAVSGIYTIAPNTGSSLQVYCDMTTGDGGWLVSNYSKQVTCPSNPHAYM